MPLDYVEKIKKMAERKSICQTPSSSRRKGNGVLLAAKKHELSVGSAYLVKIKRMSSGKKTIKKITQTSKPEFSSDPKGFFVISIDPLNHKIILEHYNERYEHRMLVTGEADLIIEGDSADLLCHTVIERGLVSRFDHACYLGRELQKAETALKKSEKYIQDE